MSLTREHFRKNAKAIECKIGDLPILADVKEFSTGGLGWYANGKMTVNINGEPVKVQIGLNLSIVKSKEIPQS